jgi:hypothetical protein
MKDDLQKPSYPAPGETFIPYQFGNSALLQRNILRDPDLLPIEKNLWILLSHYAGEDGECCPSYDGIGDGLGVRRNYAVRLVRGLEEKGFIKRIIATGRGHTNSFHFIWRESFAENPFSRGEGSFTPGSNNGNGKGSLQCPISDQERDHYSAPITEERDHYSDRKGSLQCPRSEKKEKNKKPPPPLPREQHHNECSNNPDEGKGGGGLFVDGKKKKLPASLIREYCTLSVAREIHKGTEITNKAAYRSKIKCRVMEEADSETFMEELEELRAWKREQDETEELRRQARMQEEERKRQEEIHRQEREKLKADLIAEYEQSGMSEEEFFRSKPEDDNQVQCALWELFGKTGLKIAREKVDETIGKPQSKKKAAQKGRGDDASLTDEQREALLLRQFESIKDSLASLPHDAETKFCSMQAKLFDRRGDEQGIRCLNKLFHGGRHCALKDEIGRLAEETFNPESTKTTPPQLTFQTFKDIIGDLRGTYGGREIREKFCQDYPEHSSRMQEEYPF